MDVVEISTGFISLPTDDLVRLIQDVKGFGLIAKPEVGVQSGAGGGSSHSSTDGRSVDASWIIRRAEKCLEAGAQIIMMESEGITEDVGEERSNWRTEIPAQLAHALGLENIMFEAADPKVFSWYLRHFGVDCNLFVDHSQVVQLECLRRGQWGDADTWGRLLRYS